jgi:hypothetical protein
MCGNQHHCPGRDPHCSQEPSANALGRRRAARRSAARPAAQPPQNSRCVTQSVGIRQSQAAPIRIVPGMRDRPASPSRARTLCPILNPDKPSTAQSVGRVHCPPQIGSSNIERTLMPLTDRSVQSALMLMCEMFGSRIRVSGCGASGRGERVRCPGIGRRLPHPCSCTAFASPDGAGTSSADLPS